MQTTLFGLALALIAAIISALAAPLFVDWSAHRDLFEARLSAVLASPVTIAGPIDAAILPTPSVTFHDVTAVKGGVLLRVGEVRGVLSLGALLRGDVIAEDLSLVAPRIEVELDAAAPAVSATPTADLTVEQLTIEDGTLAIHQRRAGRTVTITDIDASGQLGSLAGPFRLEGRAGVKTDRTRTDRAAFRLTSGGLTEAGLRLRLTVQAGRPSIDLDGSLHVEEGEPRFDGQVVISHASGVGPLSRVLASGKLAATLDAARFDTLTLSAGPEAQALELSGSARLSLGRQMRLDAVLGARQLDLDRVFGAAPDSPALPPLTVLAGLLASVDIAGTVELPVQLGLSADAVTLGGEAVRDVRLDLAGGRTAWTVQHFEAHLPGRADIRVAGDGDAVAGFQGQMVLEAPDPGQLMGWLDSSGPARAEPTEPLKAEAKVDIRPGRLVLDDLKLAGAGLQLAGRLSWLRGGDRGALAADLTGSTLDLDALRSLVRTAGVTTAAPFAGDVRLNLGIDALRYAGVTARRVETRLGWDASTLRIDHLKVVDFGGLSAEAQGEMAKGPNGLEGGLKLSLALDGSRGLDALAGMAALPQAVVQRLETIAVPARLTAEVSPGDGRTLKAALHGKTAAGPLEVQVAAPFEQPAAASVQASLAASGASVLKLIGLDGPSGDGRLTLSWTGPAGDFAARFAAPTIEAEARGRLGLNEGRLDPDLAVTLARVDLGEVMPALRHGTLPGPLPASAVFILTRRGDGLRAAAIEGAVAGVEVSGALDIAPEQPVKLSGDLAATRLDLPTLAAALVGRSTPAKTGTANGWPTEPFGKPALPALVLDLGLATPQLGLPEGVTVTGARLALRHAPPRSELTLTAGALAGGTAQGRLILAKADSGIGADLHLALAGADLATLLPGHAAQPTEGPAGTLSLALDAAGTGRSPAELVRALAGQGTLAVERLSWPGLSSGAVGAMAGLATRERVPAEAEVRSTIAAALARGPLALPRIESPLAVLDGQLRAGPARAETADAAVRLAGALDLAALTITGDFALAPKAVSPMAQPLPGSPEIALTWAGPLQRPERRLDVSRLVTGLTLAAAERAAKIAADKMAADKAAEETAGVDGAVVGTIPAAMEPAGLKVVPLPPPRPHAPPDLAQPPEAVPAKVETAKTAPAAEVAPAASPSAAADKSSTKPESKPMPKPMPKDDAKRPAKQKGRTFRRATPATPTARAKAEPAPEPFLIDRLLKRTQSGSPATPAGGPSSAN